MAVAALSQSKRYRKTKELKPVRYGDIITDVYDKTLSTMS
jgi:hypothetical protein